MNLFGHNNYLIQIVNFMHYIRCMSNHLKPSLGTVQETLLLPLIGRSKISERFPDFFSDEKAIEICNQLNFDKRKALKNMRESGTLAMAVRAIKMDGAIRKFIAQYPKATIVNVGAGLDTAFWRVDNGQIKWIDLDLPDSIELRQQFLPPSERNPHIAKSVFDTDWINDIGDFSNGLFIQVPGVFPYIEPTIIQEFFTTFPSLLPKAEIIFDVVSEYGKVFITQGIKRSGMEKATLKWGIDHAKKLQRFNDKIEVVSDEKYFKHIERKWDFHWVTRLSMNINDLTGLGRIVHLRFKA